MKLELLTEKEFIKKYDGVEVPNFDFGNPPIDPKELSDNLIESMCAHKGIGLAATQVDIPYKVFAVGNPDSPESCSTIFNPSITFFSEEQTLIEEGCITFPHLFVKVRRPSVIRARFYDYQGNVSTAKFDGLTARIFQHEIDHLLGTNFTQRANRIHLDKAKRKRELLLRKVNKNGTIRIATRRITNNF